MGYIQLLSLQESIVLSDALIAASNIEEYTASGTYVQIKSLMRLTEIYAKCQIRVKHDMRTNLGGGYSKLYKNGLPIAGTEHYNGSGSYVAYTDDLSVTDFRAGDTIELWAYNADNTPGHNTYVRNFQICGNNVPFGEV
jgi:hypothetical protein